VLQRPDNRARALLRHARFAVLTLFVSALGAAPGLFRYGSLLRRRQIDACAARLRQSDRNRLLGRAGAVLALPDVFNFLAHKLARLRAGCLVFALVFTSALD